MKTLEQILTTGTDAEQELIRLAKEYPTNPKRILIENTIMLGAFSTGTVYLAYAIHDANIYLQCIGSVGVILGSLIIDGGVEHISQANYNLTHPEKWEKGKPSDLDHSFYTYYNKWTNNPTAVEVTFGTRVYPRQNFDRINELPTSSYGFITNVQATINEERYTNQESYFDDMSSVSRTVNIEKVRLNILFQKEKTTFQYNADYKIGKEPFLYHQLKKIQTPTLSLLLRQENSQPTIQELFSYPFSR